jgi:4-hydroxybenzoate polyprenyltransferase
MLFVYRPLYWFRNSFQYLLGATLNFLIFNSMDFVHFFTGLFALLVTYNAVYFINDIIDYDDDRKNKTKLHTKPLVKKSITFREAKIYAAASIVFGMAISLFVNSFFSLLLVSLIVLNNLYSRFKKNIKLKIPTLILIEVVKFSTGWFALSLTVSNFPFWIVLTISNMYAMVYFVYKKNITLRSAIDENRTFFISFMLFSVFSYVVSLMMYPFKLPMILMLLTSMAFLYICSRLEGMHMVGIKTHIAMSVFVLAFILLLNPTVAYVNNVISGPVDALKVNVTRAFPPKMIHTITYVEDAINYNLERTIQNISTITFSLE